MDELVYQSWKRCNDCDIQAENQWFLNMSSSSFTTRLTSNSSYYLFFVKDMDDAFHYKIVITPISQKTTNQCKRLIFQKNDSFIVLIVSCVALACGLVFCTIYETVMRFRADKNVPKNLIPIHKV